MGKRRFTILLRTTAVIELDDAVIEAVDDEWRRQFYSDLYDGDDIAEHIGFNLVVNETTLSKLDGWADQPDSNARVVSVEDWDVEAK